MREVNPWVAATRITVELILEKLAAGETIEQILCAHPQLTQEAIRAALAFVAIVVGILFGIARVATLANRSL